MNEIHRPPLEKLLEDVEESLMNVQWDGQPDDQYLQQLVKDATALCEHLRSMGWARR